MNRKQFTPLKRIGQSLMLGLCLLTTQAQAGGTASQTKTVANLSYKLTYASPLREGQQKLVLRVARAGQLVRQVKLTGLALMDDGMKSPLKVKPRPNGEIELSVKLDMAGEWQLKLQQTAPTKANILFLLDVTGSTQHQHMH